MKKEIFKFHVQNIAFGWCRVAMYIYDKEIHYNAGYLGPNPLESFVDACFDYLIEKGEYHIVWQAEPGQMKITLNLDESNMLHLDIVDQNEDGVTIYGEWHEVIPYNAFVESVVSEGFRVLNAFGLYGYRCSWSDKTEFPLSELLRITDSIMEVMIRDSYNSDLSKEMECLQENIAKLEITEKRIMKVCTVYYESWQLQCCGEPFKVGDKVEWNCVIAKGYKNAHGIIVDLEEEHHGFATHSVTGFVTKILAERSEFPKGQKEVWYEKACTIQEEIKRADGWESDYKSDDVKDRTFWGYIVELKDVTVKPITKWK